MRQWREGDNVPFRRHRAPIVARNSARDPTPALLLLWGEHQRKLLSLSGWCPRSPLLKVLRGEPRGGHFHSQLPRGVAFDRREDLAPVARIEAALEELRRRDEPVWLALALHALLPPPYLTNADRARIAGTALAAYRRQLRAGTLALRALLDGKCHSVADALPELAGPEPSGSAPEGRREAGESGAGFAMEPEER